MHDPQPEFRPVAGRAEPLGDDILRLVAPNPSPMTFRGTNTYLVGRRNMAVIDPGPADPAHLAAILDALPHGARVSHILVTHAHLDHSALAPALAERTGAPVCAFGPATAGRSPAMQALARAGTAAGGEGVDTTFAPSRTLPDGACVETDEWRIEALHLPGHMGNHMGFALGDRLFTGDVVMGWASSLISPPDGDVGRFMSSLERLAARSWSLLLPGHGAPVPDPAQRIEALRAHRADRHAAILAALRSGPRTAATLAAELYHDTPEDLLPAAARNVFAHLVAMTEDGATRPLDPPGPSARYQLIARDLA